MEKKSVKTRVKKKVRLKIKGVLLLACIVIVLIFLVTELLKVNVTTVKVTGNDYLKDAEIIKLAGFNNETKFFEFRKKEVCENLQKNALVSTCKIKRKWNLQIEIEITENVPLFYYANESAVVLSDGTRMSNENIYGLPTLVNLTTEKVLNEFIDGLSKVKSDIIHSISEIEYSPSISASGVYIDEERFILSMIDGNTIYINNRNLDVLNRYDTIYATLGDKKGILNFDCDFGNYPFTEYGD